MNLKGSGSPSRKKLPWSSFLAGGRSDSGSNIAASMLSGYWMAIQKKKKVGLKNILRFQLNHLTCLIKLFSFLYEISRLDSSQNFSI